MSEAGSPKCHVVLGDCAFEVEPGERTLGALPLEGMKGSLIRSLFFQESCNKRISLLPSHVLASCLAICHFSVTVLQCCHVVMKSREALTRASIFLLGLSAFKTGPNKPLLLIKYTTSGISL